MSLTLLLALAGCAKSDIGIYESSEAACDGLLGPDEDEVVDSPWDADGDGYFDARNPECADTYAAGDLDCDDGDAEVHPGAVEFCDYIDNNCDGAIDEDSAADAARWFADDDSDGFGDRGDVAEACDVPFGYTGDDSDCDDDNERVFPGATEACDGFDNDCDAFVDEDAADASVWYPDRDGDGYGDETDPGLEACEAPEGTVGNREDCDDGEPTVNPYHEEVCDGLDNDCDDVVEEDAVGNAVWYADFDRDGFGDADSAVESCSQPKNHVSDDRDCDDTNSTINPDADELCGGGDEDCDTLVDEAGAADAPTWYLDDDNDGYGDDDVSAVACEAPVDHIEDPGDCDDTDRTINPDEYEICDEEDQDCDGAVDEDAEDAERYYLDDDNDGFGDEDDAGVDACEEPAGHADNDDDCDDSDDDVNPDAEEVCEDGLDNDCSDGDEVCEETSYSGTWLLDSTVSYSCVFGIVNLNFATVTVSDAYPTIVVSTSGAQPGSMAGSFSSDTDFYVENVYSGSCTETYSLDASFVDENTFEGTFTAAFTGGGGACFDCTTQTWSVTGTR